MRTWDGECSIPQIMRAFNFLVTVQKLQHTCTFFPHHFLLLNLKLEQLCSESERERGLLPCQHDTQAKEVRWDETNNLRFLQLNCWIFYCANDIRWRGLSHFFWRLIPPAAVLPIYFLPRQLSLFWHISDSCHRFNCIRRWQVYSLRGGVWCPQVNVPSRGHVGTSKMSSWLKKEK